jgi:membrane protein YqaA with SNARE-associated domain
MAVNVPPKGRARLLGTFLLWVAASLVLLLVVGQRGIPRATSYGALFLLAILSSTTFVVPGPSLIGVGFGGAILNPWIVGVVMGTGSTIGDLPGFIFGAANREGLTWLPGARLVTEWMSRRARLTLFFLAATPNPLFDIGSVVAGACAMPIVQYSGITLGGKIIRFTAVAWLIRVIYDLYA